MNNKQKFKRGDIVHISADLGPSMSHFTADKDAVIIGSYKDQYGSNNINDYTVMFYDGNKCSWYHSDQMTFLRYGGEKEIIRIKEERENREKLETDLSWIVSNWKIIREGEIPGATIGELMRRVGITNLWGANGEGITYYTNALATFWLLDPILSTGNIKEVEEFLEKLNHAK